MKTDVKNSKGFTLIETIIAIVAAAILATMVFVYSGASLSQSAKTLHDSKKAMDLQKVMENILADYNKYYKADLTGIKNKISTPSTSGYGQYTVVENSFITVQGGDPAESVLKVTIKNELGETLTVLLTKIVSS